MKLYFDQDYLADLYTKVLLNDLEPFLPTHPGEVLKDELEFRGISQRRLASDIGVSPSLVNEVLNAKRSLNPELALLIGAALGLDPAPLLALQADYDLIMAKRDQSLMNRLSSISKIAAAF